MQYILGPFGGLIEADSDEAQAILNAVPQEPEPQKPAGSPDPVLPIAPTNPVEPRVPLAAPVAPAPLIE